MRGWVDGYGDGGGRGVRGAGGQAAFFLAERDGGGGGDKGIF